MSRGAGAQRLRGRTSPLAASSAPLEYTWPQMAARGASGTPPLTGWVRDGRLRSNPSPPPFLALRREGGWGHPPLQREFLRPLYFTALNRYAISSLSHMRTHVFGVFLKGRICAWCTKRRGDGYAPPPRRAHRPRCAVTPPSATVLYGSCNVRPPPHPVGEGVPALPLAGTARNSGADGWLLKRPFPSHP